VSPQPRSKTPQAVALAFDQGYYDWLLSHYNMERDLLVSILNRVGLTCSRPEGAYYLLADMSIYDFPDSVAFCEYLMKQVGVSEKNPRLEARCHWGELA